MNERSREQITTTLKLLSLTSEDENLVQKLCAYIWAEAQLAQLNGEENDVR